MGLASFLGDRSSDITRMIWDIYATKTAVRKKQTVCLCNRCRDRELGQVPFFKDREGEGKKGKKEKKVTQATEASDPDSDQTLQFDCY
uniref:Uncharacterized protein n=1 Tax=Magallana gigas TaxID=29159 RepID=A0A8W8JQE4_MAGGI